MLKIVTAVIGRDLKLAMRRQADIVSALFFFVIVVSLFPLGVGPEPDLLRKLAPGVLWVAALLATMLSLPRLFADDHRDGTLEQLALAPHPLGLVVTGKVIAHWLVSGLPLALIAPVLGIQFDLSGDALIVLPVPSCSARRPCPASGPLVRHSPWACEAAAYCSRCLCCRSTFRC